MSPAPEPLLPSPTGETLSRVDELTSSGPATQPEQSGPPPGRVILKAKELLQEGSSPEPTAVHLCLGTLGALLLSQLPPAQDTSLARRPRSDNTPLLMLPENQYSAGRWHPNKDLKPEHWVPFILAPAWATPQATQQTRQ